ncbi:MAG: hypothetical protein OSJ43_06170 [Oscillospiraceae bacterium]|nr:hypothetical protein [Oscillospiraceae bacterium]
MEVTNIIKMEFTAIEDNHDDKRDLPFGAKDKAALAKEIKKRLDCDDVQIKSIKQFSIDKGGEAHKEDD